VRRLNPSAVLNFKKPSMDFEINKPGELRFMRNSSIYENLSTTVRRVNEKPEPDGLWFSLSSGGWIRTNDLRVMSQEPKSVLFVRRALQFSQTGERWFLLARNAMVVDQCAYSSFFTWVRQVPFFEFLRQSFQINRYKFIFEWGEQPVGCKKSIVWFPRKITGFPHSHQ